MQETEDVLHKSEEASRVRPPLVGKTRLAEYGTSPLFNNPYSPLYTPVSVGAVRRAAERSNDLKNVLHLEATITRQIKALEAEDYEAFFKFDEALHKAFFEMAGVPGVWQVVKKTQSDVYRIRHLKRLHNIRRGNQVVEEHKAIVEAIRCGSADDAENALIAHIGSLESEIDQMSSHPEILDFIDTLNASRKRPKR